MTFLTPDEPPIRKPQVIHRRVIGKETHFIKKWSNGDLSIEGFYNPEEAKNHNINVPDYFFWIDQECADETIKKP